MLADVTCTLVENEFVRFKRQLFRNRVTVHGSDQLQNRCTQSNGTFLLGTYSANNWSLSADIHIDSVMEGTKNATVLNRE